MSFSALVAPRPLQSTPRCPPLMPDPTPQTGSTETSHVHSPPWCPRIVQQAPPVLTRHPPRSSLSLSPPSGQPWPRPDGGCPGTPLHTFDPLIVSLGSIAGGVFLLGRVVSLITIAILSSLSVRPIAVSVSLVVTVVVVGVCHGFKDVLTFTARRKLYRHNQ